MCTFPNKKIEVSLQHNENSATVQGSPCLREAGPVPQA